MLMPKLLLLFYTEYTEAGSSPRFVRKIHSELSNSFLQQQIKKSVDQLLWGWKHSAPPVSVLRETDREVECISLLQAKILPASSLRPRSGNFKFQSGRQNCAVTSLQTQILEMYEFYTSCNKSSRERCTAF